MCTIHANFVLQFHSMEDEVVLFDGGNIGDFADLILEIRPVTFRVRLIPHMGCP